MQQGKVDLVIVGADRITANGDTANKIGTYALAVLARAHGIPFYVAAPLSTIDPSLPDGRAIPIEERNPSEVTSLGGVRTAPGGDPRLESRLRRDAEPPDHGHRHRGGYPPAALHRGHRAGVRTLPSSGLRALSDGPGRIPETRSQPPPDPECRRQNFLTVDNNLMISNRLPMPARRHTPSGIRGPSPLIQRLVCRVIRPKFRRAKLFDRRQISNDIG